MKTTGLYGILFFSFLSILWIGCDDESYQPITLGYEDEHILFDNEKRAIVLTPFSEMRPLCIRGGNGRYTVGNSDESIVRVVYDGTKLSLKPVALGTASITIEDGESQPYVLNVTVKYRQSILWVAEKNWLIEGDDLTVGEQKELKEKAASSSRIEKYSFVFTDRDDREGEARLQLAGEGGKPVEKVYKFTNESLEATEENTPVIDGRPIRVIARITLKAEPEEIVLYLTRDFFGNLKSASMKTDMLMAYYCLVRDLTGNYRADYPALQHIYEIQSVYGR